MKDVYKALVGAAVLAPSGDNIQPWRFIVDDRRRTIRLTLHEDRAVDVFDPGYRFAFVAMGAAVENMRRTAELNGLKVNIEYRLMELSVLFHVEERLEEVGHHWRQDPLLSSRMTNRLLYDGRPVEVHDLKTLQARHGLDDGFKVWWITDRRRLEALSQLVGQADSMLFAVPEVFEAFVRRVNFENDTKPVEFGMPVEALGAVGLEKQVLRISSQLPRSVMPNRLGGHLLGRHTRELLASASGLCVVTASHDSLQAALSLGREVQDLWLLLTSKNLWVQPMGSLYILDYVSSHPASKVKGRFKRAKVERLLQKFRQIVPEIGQDHLAFMLRFGYADSPLARTGRLSVEEVIEEV